MTNLITPEKSATSGNLRLRLISLDIDSEAFKGSIIWCEIVLGCKGADLVVLGMGIFRVLFSVDLSNFSVDLTFTDELTLGLDRLASDITTSSSFDCVRDVWNWVEFVESCFVDESCDYIHKHSLKS